MKNQTASGMLGTTIERIKELVDTSTVIGDPIKVNEKITIIPVSSVKYGFASGGSDFPSKANQDLFGGAGGAGITVTPVAFLVVNDDVVTIKNVGPGTEGPLERLSNAIPDAVTAISGLVDKLTKDKNEETIINEAIENIE